MEWLGSLILGNAILAPLMAVGVQGICWLPVLRNRPAVVHGLWTIVLLKFIVPPCFFLACPTWNSPLNPSSPIPLGNTPAAAVWAEPSTPASGHVSRMSVSLPGLLAVVSLVGACVLCWRTGRQARRFSRLLRHAEPAPAEIQRMAEEIATAWGIRRCPEVRFVRARFSPLVWTVGGAPLLVIPEASSLNLSTDEWRLLLAHELAHVRRGDHRLRWLELAVRGMYWWHPAAWWACHELRQAEEACCDALVVRAFSGQATTYAQTLLRIVDFLADAEMPLPRMASGFGRVSHLKRRLEMLMRTNSEPAWPRATKWAVLGLAACLLPIAWRAAPAAETEAETPPEKVIRVKARHPDGSTPEYTGIEKMIMNEKGIWIPVKEDVGYFFAHDEAAMKTKIFQQLHEEERALWRESENLRALGKEDEARDKRHEWQYAMLRNQLEGLQYARRVERQEWTKQLTELQTTVKELQAELRTLREGAAK